ncbi:hypothetical protein JTE90_027433 [Oedothorax gibbosus]|uniref:Transmembrane protein n=1 Tax=Oedothorax gibbosus TaxID=931172 RepID=A0AAV6VZ50_9ARAC|nr:hypothetical protein JTE90_027433 [Oedothorax gibbosus]
MAMLFKIAAIVCILVIGAIPILRAEDDEDATHETAVKTVVYTIEPTPAPETATEAVNGTSAGSPWGGLFSASSQVVRSVFALEVCLFAGFAFYLVNK